MKLEDARQLQSALAKAIAAAEQAGSDEVDLRGALDAELSATLDEAQAALDARKTTSG